MNGAAETTPTAAGESLVCVAYSTIMSGLVLRWYADETQRREVANAGREKAWFQGFPSDEFRAHVEAAHDAIRTAYIHDWYPEIDVSRWVTHRTVGIFSSEIWPVSS